MNNARILERRNGSLLGGLLLDYGLLSEQRGDVTRFGHCLGQRVEARPGVGGEPYANRRSFPCISHSIPARGEKKQMRKIGDREVFGERVAGRPEQVKREVMERPVRHGAQVVAARDLELLESFTDVAEQAGQVSLEHVFGIPRDKAPTQRRVLYLPPSLPYEQAEW